MAAHLVGKEAGLFVTSGTMGNLTALLAHCGRGDEVILGDSSHTFNYEAGGMAALGGVQPHPVQNQSDGTLALQDMQAGIRADDAHHPRTRLICLENTHNLCGGAPLSPEYTAQVGALASAHGLRLHIDGARIFNSAVAQNVVVTDLTGPADSVTFCLSKGLCAPVGSVLCGSEDFIHRAHRVRKMLGGGMRQAGVLAAAGIVALEGMIERLADDHEHARQLAAGLSQIRYIRLDRGSPQTNMVFINLTPDCPLDAPTVAGELAERSIRVQVKGPRRFRAVTHYWITTSMIEDTVEAFRDILRK